MSESMIILRWTDSSLPNTQLPTDNRIYTVRYSKVHGDNQRWKNIESTDLEVTIDGLRPNTQYMFEVKVSKGRVQSTWSLSVVNRTYEARKRLLKVELAPSLRSAMLIAFPDPWGKFKVKSHKSKKSKLPDLSDLIFVRHLCVWTAKVKTVRIKLTTKNRSSQKNFTKRGLGDGRLFANLSKSQLKFCLTLS